MKKRMIAMLLSICLLFSLLPMTVIAVDEDFGISEDGTFETPDPEATDPEETEPEETEPQETEPEETEPEETEPENEEPALYDQLMAAESVEDMYLLMLAAMENDMESLLALTREEIAQLRVRVAELDPEADDIDTQDLLDTLDFLPNGGTVESAYDLIASATSLGEMWQIMSAEENAEGVEALTYDEIEDLRHKANGYYCHLEFPANDATYNYGKIEETLNQLVYNKNVNDIALYDNWSGSYTGRTVKRGNTLNINLTGNVTLNGQISIYGTVNITTTGDYSITRSTYNNIFKVYSGGKLNITGSDGNIITIKGVSRGSTAAIEVDGGTLNLNYVKLYNCRNGTGNTWGGAIYHANNVTSTIQNTIIDSCVAGNGSAVYFHGSCTGTILIKNSIIMGCTATTGEYDGTIRTMGDTGCKLTIESCTIKDNTSGLNGGGVYWNARGTGASLTITGTAEKPTVISNNKADNGGGIFLSGSSIEIRNTQIIGNHATYGGGIDMQPYDYTGVHSGPGSSLILGNGAKILDNEATEHGGGIYMQIDSGSTTDGSDFVVTVEGDALVRGNKAKYGGAIAITQTIGNASSGSADKNRKYDAYININGGTISGNEASVNGGAFYINREKYGNSNYDLKVKITGGSIFGNKATGDGGAVYLKDDSAKAEVTVSGGTIGGAESSAANTAVNGGAIYVSGGSVNMSGGNISSNTATKDGGAVYVTGGGVNMSGGTISGNTATKDGGAVYVTGGSYTMSNGTISGNTATQNGGAVYVTGGSYTMNNGTISGNTATQNGGAAYVTGGSYTMNNGTISGNTATQNGGAVYVNGGSVTMSDGKMETNTAAGNGGAVYVTGGSYTMTSGKIIGNKATGATSNGGGVYVQGGNIVIGVNGCDGAGTNHTVAPTDKIHPVIENNTAKDSGGGIALVGNGNITMYCGDIVNNQAINSGRGLNIYMEQGQFDYYHGDVGELQSPELVIVGGKLYDHNKEDFVELHYYHCNIASHVGSHTDKMVDKVASASEGAWFNLPDGEKYWDAQSGYRFFGWTFNGPETAQVFVRDKDDYSPLGKAMQAIDKHDDNTSDNNIHMYALWAPETSSITYVGSVIDGVYADDPLVFSGDHPAQYTFEYSAQDIVISNPTKPGYEFDGWYLYQEENQNANWGIEYEPVYKVGTTSGYGNLDYAQMTDEQFFAAGKNGTTAIKAEATTFGDIVLIAKFTPAFTNLKITKSGANDIDTKQSFLFKITGAPYNSDLDDIDMTVTIQGNGEVTIQDLPVGTYTVTELESWSWRYDAADAEQNVDLKDPEKTEEVKFENTRSNPKWLDGESFAKNVFAAVTANS